MDNIIKHLPNYAYHHGEELSEWLSSTQLKKLDVSPKAFKFSLTQEPETSPALNLGDCFHQAMQCLSEGVSVAEYAQLCQVFQPPVNPTTGQPYGMATKAYTSAYEQFLASTDPGKPIYGPEQAATVMGMLNSVTDPRTATGQMVRRLLRWGDAEVTYTAEIEGVKLKVRPDLITKSKIIDWKTTAEDNLSEDNLNRIILKYGYHISAAMYQRVVREVTGKWMDFYLVFVSKQAPHDCLMVDMCNYGYAYNPEVDIVSMGPGAHEFERLLRLYRQCRDSGQWPGVESFIGDEELKILQIKPPQYYLNKINSI